MYADALETTRFAFMEFKRRTDTDGVRVVVLAASQLVTSAGPKDKAHYAIRRLRQILEQLGIPLIDQNDFILHRGGDPLAAQFRHDAHWTEQGHRWAAEAVMQYLENNETICKVAVP